MRKTAAMVWLAFLLLALPGTAFAGEKGRIPTTEGTISAIPSNAERYALQCKNYLSGLKRDGVSVLVANTPEEMTEYISSALPRNNYSDVSVTLKILGEKIGEDSYTDDFKPAVNGTYLSRDGKDGQFSVILTITNINNVKEQYDVRNSIKIVSIPYTGGSVNSLSSPEKESLGLIVTGANILSGTWERSGDKWMLRGPNDQYAASRWAFLDGHWYLIGSDGYMLTGWQLVNGKWYYMDVSGAMLADTVTPDGYYVNASGEWIQ